MKFKYNKIPVRIKNPKVYCKDPFIKYILTARLKMTDLFVEDQHINPLNVFIHELQQTGGITDVEYEKGDDDDWENGIIH